MAAPSSTAAPSAASRGVRFGCARLPTGDILPIDGFHTRPRSRFRLPDTVPAGTFQTLHPGLPTLSIPARQTLHPGPPTLCIPARRTLHPGAPDPVSPANLTCETGVSRT